MVEQRHGQGAPGRPHRRYPEVFNLVSIFTRITDAPKALHLVRLRRLNALSITSSISLPPIY